MGEVYRSIQTGPDMKDIGSRVNDMAKAEKSILMEIYTGDYFEDNQHGQGILLWADGSEYIGEFYRGMI
jgi:hypothetical protein